MRIWNRVPVRRLIAAAAAMAVLAATAVALPGCSQTADFLLGHEKTTGVQEDLALMGRLRTELPDRPYVNAERVAIFYSRSLYAPEDLYQTVASDARKMEPYLPFTQSDLDYSSDADYGKTPAMYAPLFQEPWMRGMISIRADSATYDAMLSGSYHDWDRLNEALGVWGGPWRGVGHREVLISFSNRLHPKRVARMYAALPGVTEAGTQPESYYWQECLVHFERGRRTYYHRLGSGICTDTCTSYVWTVIRVDGDGARVLDTWEGDPPEAWADEIAVAKAEYVACTEGWE